MYTIYKSTNKPIRTVETSGPDFNKRYPNKFIAPSKMLMDTRSPARMGRDRNIATDTTAVIAWFTPIAVRTGIHRKHAIPMAHTVTQKNIVCTLNCAGSVVDFEFSM